MYRTTRAPRLATFAALCAIAPTALHSYAASTTLWSIGTDNFSSAEFSDYPGAPSAVDIPLSGSFPKGLKASVNSSITLRFSLASLPAHGAELVMRSLDADKSTPQMAVFANEILAGIVQIQGVGRTTSPYKFRQTYRLYIPRELLRAGANALKLEAIRGYYGGSTGDQYNWWEWDFVRLEALGEAATEPTHGRYVRMAVEFPWMNNGNCAPLIKAMHSYCGVAYSGNVVRVPFWQDLQGGWDNGTAAGVYGNLKDVNMGACADYLHTASTSLVNGDLSDATKQAVRSVLQRYGSMFHIIEVDNEPGLFNRNKAVDIAYARFLRQEVPLIAPHVKIAAPGWAYWPTNGIPAGWERDPVQRWEVEQYCDWTGGHSYGYSHVDDQGGSLIENLETYGLRGLLTGDGFSKPMMCTETGNNNGHRDGNEFGSTQPYASSFDRICRAHIGFCDIFNIYCYNDADYSVFSGITSVDNMTAYPGVSGQDTRLRTFRRLACAYATHGSPLPFTYLNESALRNTKAYFRAVNTATLGAMPGSGATSDKVLLNFVNFDNTARTIQVRVTLPQAGTWSGESFTSAGVYNQAHGSVAAFSAAPTADFTVALGAGDAVQYILRCDSPITLSGPDLAVDSIWWSPSAVVAGDSVSVRARIRNLGNQAVTQASGVRFTIDGARLDGAAVPAPMAAGDTVTVVCPTRWVAVGGSHVCEVSADTANTVSETSETNNALTASLAPLGNERAINCGGPVASPFAADANFTGGTAYTQSGAVSTSGVSGAAPAEVYQSCRWGAFSYTIAGLAPTQTHTVRLHFADLTFSTAGARVFNVAVNGTPSLSSFDIAAIAGASHTAVVRELVASADSRGRITIEFTRGPADNPCVSGIETVSGSSTQAGRGGSLSGVKEGVRADGRSGHVTCTVAGTGQVDLRVYTLRGAHVTTLTSARLEAGTYEYRLPALSRGWYVVRMTRDGAARSQTMILSEPELSR